MKKRYDRRTNITVDYKEYAAGGFTCKHCRAWVAINRLIGTANRNHCNYCLWSRHVDEAKGDRHATCFGGMRPIGLTFKHEGYGKQGELMLIHACQGCGKLSINRVARDDDEATILEAYEYTIDDVAMRRIQAQSIRVLGPDDRPEVMRQLFGMTT